MTTTPSAAVSAIIFHHKMPTIYLIVLKADKLFSHEKVCAVLIKGTDWWNSRKKLNEVDDDITLLEIFLSGGDHFSKIYQII